MSYLFSLASQAVVDIPGESSWRRLPPARPATPPGPRPRGKSPRGGRRDSAQATPLRHIPRSVCAPFPDPIPPTMICQSQEPTPLCFGATRREYGNHKGTEDTKINRGSDDRAAQRARRGPGTANHAKYANVLTTDDTDKHGWVGQRATESRENPFFAQRRRGRREGAGVPRNFRKGVGS